MKKDDVIRVLTALFVVVTAMQFPSMASYISESDGSSSVSVASFRNNAAPVPKSSMLDFNTGIYEKVDYEFIVSNHLYGDVSDVGQTYYIVVTLDKPLNENIDIKVDRIQGITDDNKTFTFKSNGFTLKTGSTEDIKHILSFELKDPSVRVTDNFSADINVVFEQAD